MFYEIIENRKQIRWYDQNRTPDKSLIDECLHKTYTAVASKQNLMPYKVWAIGPFNKKLNEGLYAISQHHSGVKANYNLLTAPYQFVYTVRLAEGNSKVFSDITVGHQQPPMDPERYKDRIIIKNTNIEIGMHATILSKLLIENGLDVSYTLCFENWTTHPEYWAEQGFDFIDDEVQFIMSAGYPDNERYYESTEDKPEYLNIVEWI